MEEIISIGQTKRKLADHKLEEKERSARDVRKRCTSCYEKIRQQQSREASVSTAKKVKTFCLDCFNEKHFSMR